MFVIRLLLIAMVTISIYANCGIDKDSIRLLSNDFSSVNIVANYAKKCQSNSVFYKQLLTDNRNALQVPALSKNPAEYTTVIVGNLAIMPLIANDLIRPLDTLVAKYGKHLDKNQFITINGKIMAIAFMINVQHLIYRADILEQVGVKQPPKAMNKYYK